jgi:phosphatidylserine decarboxylase
LTDSTTIPVTPTRRAGLPIAREGYRLIAVAFVAALALWWAVGALGAMLGAILSAFVLGFFRDPERAVPSRPGLIVSPADGRIIKVARVQDDRFLHGEATLVSIFMSPLDVHINRVPIAGRVIEMRYNPGKYFRAFADKASLDNEQNAVVMEDERGRRLCFVQIAGFIARRIVCYLRVGMETQRGQRCGMITFGSRADLYLPAETRVCVEVGMRARGGVTVIGQWT